jgi:Pyruvate/2-oxoacid:ferredoxin oxidoreductase gamma subunit
MVILGKFLSASNIIPLEVIEESIKQNIPEQFIEKNLESIRKGYTN